MPEEAHAETREEPSGPRPFWSGTISFGLVSVPVGLFSARRRGGVALRMLDEDGTPLERHFFCPKDDEEVDREHIVRGYELASGKHVVVTDKELESVEPAKSRDIDLERFVARDAIDPRFFERSYFLVPAGGNTKAYRLLADALEEAGHAGIGTFVMHDREYWVAIFAECGILRAETLRFAEELRDPQAAGLDDLPKPKKAEVERFGRAIAKLEAKKLDRDELADTETDRLVALVERKRKAGRDVVQSPEGAANGGDEAEDNVVDMMEVLRERMRGRKAGAQARPRARGATKGRKKGVARR